MAVRSSTMPPRRFVSPALKALMSQRSAEFGGLILGMIGLAMLLALATYNPRDPSLNTASTQHVQNMTGPVGAVVADLLLQGFGVVAVLPALAMLAWCWRIGSRRGLNTFPLRLAALLAAMPMLAAVIGAVPVPVPQEHPWPVMAGLGGSIGQILATNAIVMTRSALGLGGVGLVWLAGSALALLLTLTSLGLSRSEWRSAGHFAGAAARFSVRSGRFGFDTVSQGSEGLGRFGSRFSLSRFSLRRGGEPGAPREYNVEPRVNRGSAEEPFRSIPPRPAARVPLPPDTPVTPGLSAPLPPVRTIKQVEPSTRRPVQPSLPLPEHGWVFPSLDLLKPAPARANSGPSEESLQANARLLETVLSDYGVQGEIVEIRPGPVVTLYELVPAPGIRSARVIGLADDVARSLSVTAVRIATVSGRNVIGIEVPNSKRETVFLSEILSSEEFTKNSGRLAIALGKDIGGKSVAADLSRMPHLMIAGTTGSGKSVGVNAMILSLLYRLSPDQCRLILIDPKMLELSTYEGIPHLMAPVVTEPAKAVTALKWTVREMERRYRAMSQLGVRNIGGYNDRVLEARAKGEVVTRKVQTGFDPDTGRPTFEEQPLALEPLPFIVVVVDEMADLMMVAGKEIEAAVQRLAQMARAAGIHVIMATQRPSVDVITGTIKANFPTRISFQVISKFDSRTILGEQGAEQLLGMGDMLFMQGGGRVTRVHGPFVSDEEVEKVVAYLREQGEPAYIEEVTDAMESGDSGDGGAMSGIAGASDGDKSLFDLAVDVVSREGKASTSFIQRHLNIGYNKAAKLIEQMEKEGIVGPANHVGKREILVRRTHDDGGDDC
jgi:DNA segregation ATPase FtsK/SpoIIIE, S-DNA-T family